MSVSRQGWPGLERVGWQDYCLTLELEAGAALADELSGSAREDVRVAEAFEDVQIVTNPGPCPLQVWFEPWGMPHMLSPGEAFRVVGRSPEPGKMEVVAAGESVAVYGWPRSTLRVYNGEALVDDFSIVFPELPPGMSPRGFVEFMFGGPGGPATPMPSGRRVICDQSGDGITR